MNRKLWIGHRCHFICQERAQEFYNKPIWPLAEQKGWVYNGIIESVKIAPPVGNIPSYDCSVRGRSGKTLTVNSTRQYLRLIDG